MRLKAGLAKWDGRNAATDSTERGADNFQPAPIRDFASYGLPCQSLGPARRARHTTTRDRFETIPYLTGLARDRAEQTKQSLEADSASGHGFKTLAPHLFWKASDTQLGKTTARDTGHTHVELIGLRVELPTLASQAM